MVRVFLRWATTGSGERAGSPRRGRWSHPQSRATPSPRWAYRTAPRQRRPAATGDVLLRLAPSATALSSEMPQPPAAAAAYQGDDGSVAPPQQLLGHPGRPGDQRETCRTAGVVDGHSAVRFTGVPFECVEVKTNSTFTGEAEGRQHDGAWWVPSLAVAVTSDETLERTSQGVPFEIRKRRTLVRRP